MLFQLDLEELLESWILWVRSGRVDREDSSRSCPGTELVAGVHRVAQADGSRVSFLQRKVKLNSLLLEIKTFTIYFSVYPEKNLTGEVPEMQGLLLKVELFLLEQRKK